MPTNPVTMQVFIEDVQISASEWSDILTYSRQAISEISGTLSYAIFQAEKKPFDFVEQELPGFRAENQRVARYNLFELPVKMAEQEPKYVWNWMIQERRRLERRRERLQTRYLRGVS